MGSSFIVHINNQIWKDRSRAQAVSRIYSSERIQKLKTYPAGQRVKISAEGGVLYSNLLYFEDVLKISQIYILKPECSAKSRSLEISYM